MNNVQGNLFRPLTLPNGLSLENRFVLSPMVTNSSTSEGFVTDDDIAYAVRRAKSAPLQITGAAYITEYGQLFEYGFSVSKDEDIPGLTKLAKAMKSKGAKAVLQLTHAGRFSSHTLARHGYVYGPSPMQLQSPYPHQVKELTHKDILRIIDEYVQATRRAIQAGFDGVEISSAQRLLIQTFFSTFSNQRKDEYGPQTLTNRCRLGLEVFKAVQKVIREEAENIAKTLDIWMLGNKDFNEFATFPTIEEANHYQLTPEQKAKIKSNRHRMIVGDPKQVKESLDALVNASQAEELLLIPLVPGLDQRIKSLKLLSQLY